ncbi:hypothetical protein [Mesorhizobium sp. B2-3-10]|uniref:hypothetical protein n=1 Tax=Mesorhizobium sp. B2-3-10 TaxID=2589954 RepID=UPI0011277034|nr:hypothetical protein [Mesorhizobium sp. B2-3-10]TPM04528.1 hypothetical protein FJ943_03970 [Mesorhizobium sp. B2-3-10]
MLPPVRGCTLDVDDKDMPTAFLVGLLTEEGTKSFTLNAANKVERSDDSMKSKWFRPNVAGLRPDCAKSAASLRDLVLGVRSKAPFQLLCAQ